MDLHCDGQIPACSGVPLWSKGFGPDFLRDARVAVDPSGNVVLAGSFEGKADFGGGAMNSAGGSDIFVAELAGDGSFRWAKSFGNGNILDGVSIAVDSSANVLVTGYFAGMLDLGCAGSVLNSGFAQDVFVAKLGADGSCVWLTAPTGSGPQTPTSIAADASGAVVLTGYFSGTLEFGASPLDAASGQDIFVAKLGPDGSPLWAKAFGDGAHAAAGRSLAVDASGNVVLTGDFTGTVDFGGNAPLSSPGAKDVFVAKLGADGSYLWAKAFGDGYHDAIGHGVAVGTSGHVVLTGQFSGALDFGGATPVTSAGGGPDVFVAKLDASTGGYVWAQQFNSGAPADSSNGESVAVDASGNVSVTGEFSGTVDFGGSLLASAGGLDAFLAKLDAKTGAPLWSRRFGDAKDQWGRSVAVNAAGETLVAGDFAGSIYFAVGQTLVSTSGRNVFLAKFSP
jgi:hypothetical protein